MTEQQVREIIARYMNLNEYGEQMEALNVNEVNSLVAELAQASQKPASRKGGRK